MSSLTRILASLESKGRRYSVFAGEDWSQGRTLFGGLIAAIANAAMRKLVSSDRELRALQILYIGPNPPGLVDFEPLIAREGKAVTLATCTVRSGEAVTAIVNATYGVARQSVLQLSPAPDRLDAAPEAVPDAPRPPGLPGFTQHYYQRWARGGYPFSGSGDSRMSVYLKYRDEESERTSEPHALALMDAIPSPALALLTALTPASTLSWTLEVLDNRFDFSMNEWWRLDAWVDAAIHGYVTHTSHVLNPAGAVAAISRQVVVIYG